jgi:hypothetical protein
MEVTSIKGILDQYAAHGWRIRLVLATNPGETNWLEYSDDVIVRESAFNAIWFSRRSRPGAETWELRRTDGPPFALLESVPDGTSDSELQAILAVTEERMRTRNV